MTPDHAPSFLVPIEADDGVALVLIPVHNEEARTTTKEGRDWLERLAEMMRAPRPSPGAA